MGVFYTVYYAGMLVGPAIGGKFATWAGTATVALDFGAAALFVALSFLGRSTGSAACRSRWRFHPGEAAGRAETAGMAFAWQKSLRMPG